MTVYKQKVPNIPGVWIQASDVDRRFTREEITEQTTGYEIVEYDDGQGGTIPIYKINTPNGDFALCKIGDYILTEVAEPTKKWGFDRKSFDINFEEDL